MNTVTFVYLNCWFCSRLPRNVSTVSKWMELVRSSGWIHDEFIISSSLRCCCQIRMSDHSSSSRRRTHERRRFSGRKCVNVSNLKTILGSVGWLLVWAAVGEDWWEAEVWHRWKQTPGSLERPAAGLEPRRVKDLSTWLDKSYLTFASSQSVHQLWLDNVSWLLWNV